MKIPKFALPHRVTIVPFLGSGAFGPIWEIDQTKFQKRVPCRIERKTKMVKASGGVDVMQSATGIFHPDCKIKSQDKIIWTLYGLEYEVLEWFPVDAMGPHSIEVVLT